MLMGDDNPRTVVGVLTVLYSLGYMVIADGGNEIPDLLHGEP